MRRIPTPLVSATVAALVCCSGATTIATATPTNVVQPSTPTVGNTAQD